MALATMKLKDRRMPENLLSDDPSLIIDNIKWIEDNIAMMKAIIYRTIV